MRAVLLLGLSRELGGEELNRGHCWDQVIHMVLGKVSAARELTSLWRSSTRSTHIRNRPFELRWPNIGLSSPVRSLILWDQIRDCHGHSRPETYSVDFPAPLAPTMAIRESSPTSMLMSLRRSLSGAYPNETSFSCSTGGDIFSVSGNLFLFVTNCGVAPNCSRT